MAVKPVKVPDSGVINNPEGVNDILGFYNDLTRAINSLSKQAGSGDFVSGLISFPEDGDYRLVVNVPGGRKIQSTTTVSQSGTCTATFKIGATPLGGTANSVSTSEEEQTHSSANVMSAGDDLVLTVSANANCEKMSFTIRLDNA